MHVVIPKEISAGEKRVAATPETVKRLVKNGFQVSVQSGAGEGSYISDSAYEEAGATVAVDPAGMYFAANVVLKVQPPIRNEALDKHEADLLPKNSLLITFLQPHRNLGLIEKLRERSISCLAMELIPRITRAQKMDALSSQSNIAGYKSVLMAADRLGKFFPLLMTAAGNIRPAKVVVMGAGVAGLQATATAHRLGAVVWVSDIRPAVKEQVESLGANFIEIETDESLEDTSGYAKEVSKEFLEKQQALVRKHIVQADVIITTALVPGKPAPVLITADMVEEMKTGSVIVDLAVEQGGNCELSEPGEIVEKHGVTLIGELNVPSLLPVHASQLYARNVLALLMEAIKDDEIYIDLDNEIIKGCLLTHGGEVLHGPTKELLAGGRA